jgi:predicted GIY-YIG superfamily endonuclease
MGDSGFQVISPPGSTWCTVCSAAGVAYPEKRFVYIIRSLSNPRKRYVGVTSDVHSRVCRHNAGHNRSTAQWKPWGIDVTIEFRSERMAVRFEKYLKSGAGHAFANSHFTEEP